MKSDTSALQINKIMDYHISEFSEYEIYCEICPASTGRFGSEEEVSKVAVQLGFTAIDTPEDGTVNFCRDCDDLRQEEEAEGETK